MIPQQFYFDEYDRVLVRLDDEDDGYHNEFVGMFTGCVAQWVQRIELTTQSYVALNEDEVY